MTAPDPARPAPWTADQLLRSDATWDQIAEREGWLEIHRHTGLSRTIADVAFEYAIACVADRETLNVRLLHEQDTEIVRLRAELAALLPGSRYADAARPASEREALAAVVRSVIPARLNQQSRTGIDYDVADALLAAGWRRDGGENTALLDWIEEKAALANGVTIETTAWDEREQEHRSVAYHSGTEDRRVNVTWGPKMGHFAHADTLREALGMAMQRSAGRPIPTEER